MQGPHAAADVIGALQRLDADPDGRGDHHRPRRRLARGPAAVLRRGRWSGRSPPAARRSSARSATSRTPRCSTWSPTCGPRPRPTRPGGSVPDVAEQLALIDQLRARARRSLAGRLDREQLLAGRGPVPAGAGQPDARDRPARGADHGAHRAGPAVCLRPAWPGPATTSRTPGPGWWRSPRPSTLRRGYAIVQRADAGVVRAAGGLAAGELLTLRFPDDQVRVTVGDLPQPAP